MEQFLQFCRFNLSNITQFKKISLVVGNESCDLDSVVSAIVLAYIKYHELTSSYQDDADDDCDSEVIVVPVLNVFREDLHLRREVVFWFEKVLQFDLQWLICRDEIDFDAINSSSAQVFLSLVDHNENKEFVRLLPKAQFDEIIDHHQPQSPDSPQYKCDPSKVQIDTSVGSCCSLIALRYFKSAINKHKFGTGSSETYDSQIALILYGPILLDTICFSSTAKRFNAKDYEAINKLEDLMKHPADVEPSLYDRNEVYQRLVAAKNSLEGLSFEDILRKDMKIVESISDSNLAICISSITGILLTEMSLRDKLKELKSFCNNPPKTVVFSENRPRLFSAIVLVNLDNRIPNNLRRQLAIYCSNKHLMRTVATCMERSELELELITALESLRIYNQNNLNASRKVILPIISTILNGPGRSSTADGVKKLHNQSNVCSTPSKKSSKKDSKIDFVICTAEVDPEFLLNYQAETVIVPEFEELIQKSHSEDFNAENDSDSETNSKRNNEMISNVNGDMVLSSAPSSFIQQPDSYYGSFIDDSFVGEFVGDYPDADQNEHQNILVMDADGQNLVMMNPTENSCISHEIEFDFDSFGPESIIYAGNVETEKSNEQRQQQQQQQDQQNEEQVKGSNNVTVENQENTNPKITESNSETLSPTNTEAKNNDVVAEESSSNTTQNLESKPLKNNSPESSNNTFSRNSTLSKSQRKKIVPQLNMSNLDLSTDDLPTQTILNDSNITTPTNLTLNDIDENADNNNVAENSSQINKNNLSVAMNDPLGVVTNSIALNENNPQNNTNLGLNRQPSMKKKVEVNYTMFLNNSDIDDKNTTLDDDSNGILDTATTTITNTTTGDLPNTKTNNLSEPNVTIESVNSDIDLRPPVTIGNRSIDLKVIEPYKKVISHGGHLRPVSNGSNNTLECSSPAIILFAACYLPDRSQPNYHYVMENLFLYVVSTLHNMVADDYILIYLHNDGNVPKSSQTSSNGSSPSTSNNMPTFSWLKKCYQMIDRKLKKNLKGLYLVHPTFWLKTLIIMSKPFISSKFSRKLKFVRSLDELKQMIPIDDLSIPETIKM